MKVAQVKLLRRALVALIVVVMAAVAWNYVQTWRRRAQVVQQATKILGAGMLRSADSIEYSESDKGILHFRLRAKKLLETREGINLLEGIDAYDYNPDGSAKNHIQSRRAEYDRENQKADFYGDVRVHAGTDLELRTDSLHYDLAKNSGRTDDALSLTSSLTQGSAKGAWYDHTQGILELRSNLDFVVRRNIRSGEGRAQVENMRVRAGHGIYSETAHSIKLRGAVRIDSESASLSGDEITAAFSEDRKRLTALDCNGNAEYVSKDAGEERTLRGARMVFGINQASHTLERIDVFQGARFSLTAPDSEQTLSGAEIHLTLDPAGTLMTGLDATGGVTFKLTRSPDQQTLQGERLAARFVPGSNELEQMRVWGGARMSSKTGASGAGDELSAQEIRLRFAASTGRSVLRELQAEKSVNLVSAPREAAAGQPAQAGRTLSASFLQMSYSASGEFPESGRATGQVILSGIPVGETGPTEIRRLKADNVRFAFYPRDGQLRSFDGDGHVDVLYNRPGAGSDHGSSEQFHTSSTNMSAAFRESDGKADSVRQWGNFIYQDGTRTATSSIGEYDALKDVLYLRGSPKIVDEQATTTGNQLQYDQKDKILAVRGDVRSVLKPRDGDQETPFSSSSSAPSPSVVTADLMQVWTETSRVRYSGRVQMLSENSQLSAHSLELDAGGTQVDADGDIRHLLPRSRNEPPAKAGSPGTPAGGKTRQKSGTKSSPILVQSAHLRYLKEQNSIHYTGNVMMQSEDARMTADTVDVTFGAEGKVEKAAAHGRLHIVQEGRDIRGLEGDYDLALGRFVVTGNPAEITDPAKGKSVAHRLTFFTADDRILLGPQ